MDRPGGEQATMKLGKAISVEHIKRMTLRTVRESNEGQAEFLAFMNALEVNDFDENLCKREARHLEQVMTAKVRGLFFRSRRGGASGGQLCCCGGSRAMSRWRRGPLADPRRGVLGCC